MSSTGSYVGNLKRHSAWLPGVLGDAASVGVVEAPRLLIQRANKQNLISINIQLETQTESSHSFSLFADGIYLIPITPRGPAQAQL